MWDDEELEVDGPVPLWFQIADRLRTAIDKGEFQPGDLLPSEAQINSRFGVSRTTSRSALDFLEQEGCVRRRSGRGSQVLPPRVDQPLDAIGSFADDMRARGHHPGYRIRRIESARLTQEECSALHLAVGSWGLVVERVLLADDEPIASSKVALNHRLFPEERLPSIAELHDRSLYEWLETACGLHLVGGDEIIEAAQASGVVARSLGVRPGASTLVVRRTSLIRGGIPAEYAVTRYRADRYRLKVSLVHR